MDRAFARGRKGWGMCCPQQGKRRSRHHCRQGFRPRNPPAPMSGQEPPSPPPSLPRAPHWRMPEPHPANVNGTSTRSHRSQLPPGILPPPPTPCAILGHWSASPLTNVRPTRRDPHPAPSSSTLPPRGNRERGARYCVLTGIGAAAAVSRRPPPPPLWPTEALRLSCTATSTLERRATTSVACRSTTPRRQGRNRSSPEATGSDRR
jgi:hypothetical protein